ncbi:hypothetical protein SAMN05421720_109154 [Rhodospira trueperi]|uniref:Uncharacterized protein n=2 Tax=Rhodospira trueperi TaxID=69960 RepID=A0A1G7EPD9_9PROT|nr:hypothetical protein SAMN05421720_109154 [Rhodospira trueperi]
MHTDCTSTCSDPEVPTHSVVLPLNDLETLTILRLLERLEKSSRRTGIRPKGHPLTVGWGGRAVMTDAKIKALADTVILVEIPDGDLVRRIERTGRTVTIVDHHIYADAAHQAIDRRSRLSSLEQVMRHLDVRPVDLEPDFAVHCRLVAANDRGFIPHLAKELEGHDARIADIRARDLTIARVASDAPADLDLSTFDPAADPWRSECEATRTAIDDAKTALSEALGNGEARMLDTGGVPTKAAAPRLLLARVPDTHRFVMADAAAWFFKETQGHDLKEPLEMLLVFHAADDKARITQVEFSGAPDRADQIAQWFDPQVRREWPDGADRLVTYAGGTGTYFGAKDPLGGDSEALSKLVDVLLGDLLTGTRPVTAWRTSFVQALSIGDPLDSKAPPPPGEEDVPQKPPPAALKTRILDHLSDRRAAAPEAVKPVAFDDQEAHYFLPHLRDLLAWRPDPGATPDAAWEAARTQIEAGRALISLALAVPSLSFRIEWPENSTHLVVKVEEVRLHFAYNDVLLIEWTVGEQVPEFGAHSSLSWKDLLKASHPALHRPLGQVIEANAKLRFTHCAMILGSDEHTSITLNRGGTALGTLVHGEAIDTDPFTGWFKPFLQEVLGLEDTDLCQDGCLPKDKPQARLLFDDRARVVTSVVAHGAQPCSPRGKADFDVMLARLTTVDGHGTAHTCDPAAAVKEVEDGRYNRYRSWGSWYTATSHSFAFLGFDGFFPRDIIHRLHMNTMYRRMAILAQANVAILGSFSLEVGDALRFADESNATPAKRNKALTRYYRHLHWAQLEFTNHIWFDRVTSQIQGIELFDLMNRRTECRRDYDLVRDEIEQMQGFLKAEQDKQEDRNTKEEERLERTLAAIGLPFVLLFAFLGSQQIKAHFFLWPLLEWGTEALGGDPAYTWALASVAAGIVAVVVAMAVSPKFFEDLPWFSDRLKDQPEAQKSWRRRARNAILIGTVGTFLLGFGMQYTGRIMAPETESGSSAGQTDPGAPPTPEDGG